jgi:SAM-dependent methyltransferase
MSQILIPGYAQGSCGVTHVDRGMLEFFRDEAYCESMLDVGCGPGGQVITARELGYRAIGIDPDIRMYGKNGVMIGDAGRETFLLPAPADLVWSVEVAEHIPPDMVETYVRSLRANATTAICMTASQMPAELHVSVHPVEWWIEQVEASGEFEYEPETKRIVEHWSTMDREFLRETGMIFWRT